MQRGVRVGVGNLRSASMERVPPWWGDSACCCRGCCSSTANTGSFSVNGGTKNRACSTWGQHVLTSQNREGSSRVLGLVTEVKGCRVHCLLYRTLGLQDSGLCTLSCLQGMTPGCNAVLGRQQRQLVFWPGHAGPSATADKRAQILQGRHMVMCLMQA